MLFVLLLICYSNLKVRKNFLFEKNSKYFRNALVRANYQNLNQDIYYTMEYLNKFFGNLLLGEKNLLDNCEMQIKDSMMSGKESSQKSSQKILELMRQNPAITTTELAQLLNISRRAIAKQTALLKEKGLIRRIGPDKGGHWEVLNDQK